MRTSEDMYNTSSPQSRYWKYPKISLSSDWCIKKNKLWILLRQDLRDPLEKINESKKQEDQKEEVLQSNTDRWYTHTHLNAPSVYVSSSPLSSLHHVSINTHTPPYFHLILYCLLFSHTLTPSSAMSSSNMRHLSGPCLLKSKFVCVYVLHT